MPPLFYVSVLLRLTRIRSSLVYKCKISSNKHVSAFWPSSVLEFIKIICAVFSINSVVCLHSSSLACVCLIPLWNVGYVIKPDLECVSTDVFVQWGGVHVCISSTFTY